MEQYVTVLRPEEPARFNPETLERLCAEIGETRAEQEVALALQDISQSLTALGGMDVRAPCNDLGQLVGRIATASHQIGMATLERVARDVLTCLASGDKVALTATFDRLTRVGDRSIHAIWDLEDLSG